MQNLSILRVHNRVTDGAELDLQAAKFDSSTLRENRILFDALTILFDCRRVHPYDVFIKRLALNKSHRIAKTTVRCLTETMNRDGPVSR